MKVSVKLDRRFADKQGRYPVKVAISQSGETAHIPLGISVLVGQWDKKLGRVKEHPQRAALNLTIEQRIFEYRQKATYYCIVCKARGFVPSAREIRDAILGNAEPPQATLFSAYERFLPTREGNTRTSYEQTFRKVSQFVGPDDIALDDITVGWLQDFDAHLKGSGLAVNSRAVHHRNLRVLLNYAVDHDLTSNYPYRRFRIPTQATPHRALSLEDFRRVAELPLKPSLARWRDLFLLSFCLAGMNLKDLAHLKASNIRGNRLQYVRAKTHHPFSLILTPQTTELIERCSAAFQPFQVFRTESGTERTAPAQFRNSAVYAIPQTQQDPAGIFLRQQNVSPDPSQVPPQNTAKARKCHSDKFVPLSQTPSPAAEQPLLHLPPNYTNATKRLNAALRRIADELGIPHFTSYAARHSFASFAAQLSVPHDTIADLLGHARTVTDIYIKVDTRLADEALVTVVNAALPR